VFKVLETRMVDDVVTYESRDRVAIITLNRPDKLNALNKAACDGLMESWRRLEQGEDRVAILTGAGRAFSAGADLVEAAIEVYPYVPGIHIPVTKPVICAINGLCVGAAFALMHFADLAVANEDAWFSYPEPQLGTTGGLIASLAARIPHKIAMEIMLCGERISAERAYQVGFVNKVVPADQLMDAALTYANRLAANAPLVLKGLKQAVDHTIAKGPAEFAGLAKQLADSTTYSKDYREGLDAWAEKRTPKFTGE
jgi:enoyl-CoA hydratase